MAKVIEPLKLEKKLTAYFDPYYKINKCLLIFWHGCGDTVMFLTVVDKLKELYPNIQFTLGFPKGLTHEELLLPKYDYVLLTGDEVNKTADKLPYDLVAKITFPMNEGQTIYTKSEYSCLNEIGIDPVWGHNPLPVYESRLVAVHFNITCLPDSANADSATAEQIWSEILEVGAIPIESHFEHTFHNPVNKKFDFVDCSVRRVKPRISTLIGLLRVCKAFIGVVSGNFHTALATMHPKQIMLLEKDFKLECFTKLPIARVDLRNYKEGCVKQFLEGI